MKKILLSALLLLSLLVATNAFCACEVQSRVTGTCSSGAIQTIADDGSVTCYAPTLDVEAFSSMGSADAAAITAGKGLVCSSPYTIATAVTITSHFERKAGCLLTKAGTGTVHFAGSTSGYGGQWIDNSFCAGDVTGLRDVDPRWFGATYDGVAVDTDAFGKAFASGSPLILSGTSRADITPPNGFNIISKGFTLIGTMDVNGVNHGKQAGPMTIKAPAGSAYSLKLRKTTDTSFAGPLLIGDLSSTSPTDGDGIVLSGGIDNGVYFNTFGPTLVWGKAGVAYKLVTDSTDSLQRVASNTFLHPKAFYSGGGIHFIGAAHNNFINPDIEASYTGTMIKMAPTSSGAAAAGNTISGLYLENPLATAEYDIDPSTETWDITTTYDDEHLRTPLRSHVQPVIASTQSFTVTLIEANSIRANLGAASIITASMPPWQKGFTQTFIRNNAAYAFRIKPSGTNVIRLGNTSAGTGKYISIDTQAGSVTLVGTWSGVWEVIAQKAGSYSIEGAGYVLNTRGSGGVQSVGDSNATYTAGGFGTTISLNTAVTTTRTISLSTSDVASGDKVRVVRRSGCTGAYPVEIGTGPLVSLTAIKQWADLEYSSAAGAWILTGYGILP